MNTMNYETSTQPAALRATFRSDDPRSLFERAHDARICRVHQPVADSCLTRTIRNSTSASYSLTDTPGHRRTVSVLWQTLVLICCLPGAAGPCAVLKAQEIEAPGANKPGTAQSSPAKTPASASDDNHGLKIEIGSSDSSLLTPEVRAQLSPEQLYKLEIARLESKKYRGFDEDIIIPLGFFVMIIAIVGLALWTRFRRNRMMHETVRLLVEKGQPLPPDIFRENRALTPPASQLRRGIIWTAIGIGLTGFFLVGSHGNWGIGLIPLCIGLGYLLAWKLESNSKPGTGA
jgi:hypothetical protein